MDPIKDPAIVDEETLDEDEEENDSEKINLEADAEDASKKIVPPATDKAAEDKKEDGEDASEKYRPSAEEKDKGIKEMKSKEMVPLKKYLALKTKLKEFQGEDASDLTDENLEDFATEAGLQVNVVRKLANIILSKAQAAAIEAADERVKPIVQEKASRANLEAFESDFKVKIVAKYPELASKIETFKKVAFSKDFLHLKTLEDIKNEFYPDIKQKQNDVKKDGIEGGSQGGNKELETIDFAHMTDEQHKAVLADPVARQKYYTYQDSSN